MIKNTFQYKLGNPEGLKRLSQQFESSSTNVYIFGDDMLRMFYSTSFIYGFVIQVISVKTLCTKGFASNLTDIFT